MTQLQQTIITAAFLAGAVAIITVALMALAWWALS